jgi:hypothetical protein
MYSDILGHVQLLIWLQIHIVGLLDFYLPLVDFSTWSAVEVRGEGVLTPTWWVLEGVGDWESGMSEWPMLRYFG